MSSLKKLSIVAAAVVLTACGGGGGDSGSVDPVPPTTNPPVVDNNYPSTIIPANYADAQRADALNTLNAYRTQCGFNSLKQNSLLDVAAQGHAAYNQLNKIATHFQNQNNPGFTGVTLGDRIVASGYQRNGATEIVATAYGGTLYAGINSSGIEVPNSAPTGRALLNTLLSTVYHLVGAMSENNDVGVGYSVSGNTVEVPNETNFYSSLVINMSNSIGTDIPVYKGSEIRTFPCDGVSGVRPIFTSESPNPYPSRDFSVNPMGTPIYIAAPNNKKLTITEAVYKNIQTGTVLNSHIFSAENDPQKMLQTWQALIVPDLPLQSNTEYTVNIKMLVGDTASEKLIRFTTGTQQ